MADELDDRIRQVFRDAASDAPSAIALPTVTVDRTATRRRQWPVTVAAGLLLVVGGVVALQWSPSDQPNPTAAGGSTPTETGAASTEPVRPVATVDQPANSDAPVNGIPPCSAADIRVTNEVDPPADSSVSTRFGVSPVLVLANGGAEDCVIDGLPLRFVVDGAPRTSGLARVSRLVDEEVVLRVGDSKRDFFADICPDDPTSPPPSYDSVDVLFRDGTRTTVGLLGRECHDEPVDCAVEEVDASISGDGQLVVANGSSSQCRVSFSDVVFRRADGTLQRGADLGSDLARSGEWSLTPQSAISVPLDLYCPTPVAGSRIIGAGVVLMNGLLLVGDTTLDLCPQSTDPSGPVVAACEEQAIAVSVVDGEGHGQTDRHRIVLSNTGVYGDCTLPLRTTVVLLRSGDLVVPTGQQELPFSPSRLADDVVPVGETAEIWVWYSTATDATGCLDSDGGPPVGSVKARVQLPDGEMIVTSSFDVLCSPRVSPLGAPVE